MLDQTINHVLPREVTIRAALRGRGKGINRGHVRTLLRALRLAGSLDPITVWRERGPDGEPLGRLVLLDGAHRLAAYRSARPRFDNEGVPAVIFEGSWTEARLKAAGGNAKETLPLTASERADLAWSLVRDPEVKASKKAIAAATGVSVPTVGRMRQRAEKMRESKIEATGQWWRDQKDHSERDFTPPSQEEREAAIEAAAGRIYKSVSHVLWNDTEALAEALHRALKGRFKDAAEFAFGGDDEFFAAAITEDTGGDAEGDF